MVINYIFTINSIYNGIVTSIFDTIYFISIHGDYDPWLDLSVLDGDIS